MNADRRCIGFGFRSEPPKAPLINKFATLATGALGVSKDDIDRPVPPLDLDAVPPPRFAFPSHLPLRLSASAYDRVQASFSMSFEHLTLPYTGGDVLKDVVDYVVMPGSEGEVGDLLQWASSAKVAVVPRGGGTSVVGGVMNVAGFAGCVCVDLRHMADLVSVNETDMTVEVGAGMSGPNLEAALKPLNLTFRFFPQSFACSSVGGWIASRAAGHFAVGATHIDSYVVNAHMVTPTGVTADTDVPATGAGVPTKALVLGSEGAFGVITSATIRVRRPPLSRCSAVVRFADGFIAGASAVRAVVQASTLPPSNLRLVSPMEAYTMGLGDGAAAVLLLSFESSRRGAHLAPELDAALEVCRRHGGVCEPAAVRYAASATFGRKCEADVWRDNFVSAPMARDRLILTGAVIIETFETAVSWSRLPALVAAVMEDVGAAIEKATGRPGIITVRLTHVYTDGCAPYFTCVCAPVHTATATADRLRHNVTCWKAIKAVASATLRRGGATATHHHAVGRDHAAEYGKEVGGVVLRMLQAAKAQIDPCNIMNPGVSFSGQAPRSRL